MYTSLKILETSTNSKAASIISNLKSTFPSLGVNDKIPLPAVVYTCGSSDFETCVIDKRYYEIERDAYEVFYRRNLAKALACTLGTIVINDYSLRRATTKVNPGKELLSKSINTLFSKFDFETAQSVLKDLAYSRQFSPSIAEVATTNPYIFVEFCVSMADNKYSKTSNFFKMLAPSLKRGKVAYDSDGDYVFGPFMDGFKYVTSQGIELTKDAIARMFDDDTYGFVTALGIKPDPKSGLVLKSNSTELKTLSLKRSASSDEEFFNFIRSAQTI